MAAVVAFLVVSGVVGANTKKPLSAVSASGMRVTTITTKHKATKRSVKRHISTTTTTTTIATTTTSNPPTTTTTVNLDPLGGSGWNQATTTIKQCVNTHQPSNDGERGVFADLAGTITNTGPQANDYVIVVSADVPGGFSQGTNNLQVNNVAPGQITDWSTQVDVYNDPTAPFECSVIDVETEQAG